MVTKTCLLLARSDAALGPIRAAIERSGYAPTSGAPEVGRPDGFQPGDLRRVLDANLVLAFIGAGEAPASNILFELGLALGAGVPAIIVAEDGAKLPTDLSSLRRLIVKKDTDLFQALQFHLATLPEGNAVLQSARTPSIVSNPPYVSKSVLRGVVPTSAVEAQVAAALEGSDSQVIGKLESTRGGPDFVLWLKELEGTDLNPIVIEVKGALHAGVRESARRQIKRYMEDRSAGCGLLVYSGGQAGAKLDARRAIFAISVQEFLSEVHNGSLSEWIVTHRKKQLARGVNAPI